MATTLTISFLILWLVSFAVIAFFLRTSRESNVLHKRIASLVSSGGGLREGGHARVEEYLDAEFDSKVSWIEKWIAPTMFGQWLTTLLLQAQSRWPMGSLIITMASLAMLLFAMSYLIFHMFLLALAISALSTSLPLITLFLRRARRLAQFEDALPECIELCARSLRAGHSISAAIGILAEQAAEPARTEFREVFKRQNHGLPLRDALQQMLQRVPSRDLRVLVTGILVQKDTGGNLAEIMDRIAAVIRDRMRIQGDIRTHTAQGRLTGWILFLLPIGLLILINILSPGYSAILFQDPLGRKLLYAGLCLLIAGGIIIRQIVNGIEV